MWQIAFFCEGGQKIAERGQHFQNSKKSHLRFFYLPSFCFGGRPKDFMGWRSGRSQRASGYTCGDYAAVARSPVQQREMDQGKRPDRCAPSKLSASTVVRSGCGFRRGAELAPGAGIEWLTAR